MKKFQSDSNTLVSPDATLLRIIDTYNYKTKLSPVYKIQNILKLEDIHKLDLGKLMFKIVNNEKSQQCRVLFIKSKNNHNYLTSKQKKNVFISHKSKLILEKN